MNTQRQLEELGIALLRASGLPEEQAEDAAKQIVLQEMRGVITHGLRRLAASLLWIEKGVINAKANIRVVADYQGTAVVDADRALGLIGCGFAMNEAIERASKFGIGLVVVRNSQHFLSAAPYCLKAAQQGMIGIASSNTNKSMGYPGVKSALIGNNPLGFAAPANPRPLVFDTALTVSLGKLELLKRQGLKIPPEFITLDKDEQRTDEPEKVIDGGVCMPIGNHKGAGIALLIEVLTGILGGGAFLSQVRPPGERKGPGAEESQCCVAINVASFMDLEDFKARMSLLNSMFEAEGAKLPGINSWQKYEQAVQLGILPEPDVAADLNNWIEKLIPKYSFRFKI